MSMGVRLLLLLVVGALAASCTVQPDITSCDELLCPVGTECDGHGRCVADLALAACENKAAGAACQVITGSAPIAKGQCLPTSCVAIGCGTGIIDEAAGEVCADTNRDSGDGCSADCKSDEMCGNGVLDPIKGESCDDGNLVNGDGCQAGCVVPTCGDSVTDLQFNEVCDQGAANSNAANAACRPNCQPRRCGDAIVDDGEVCDDGNTTRGDGCSQECQSDETCGNGVIDSVNGETCDDGNFVDGDGCQSDCALPTCGDGVLDVGNGEYCDEGAANSETPNATCRSNCQPQRCGDGVEDDAQDEACDDGNLAAGDGCTPDCKSAEICGNGIVDFFAGEQCDDANARSSDGCVDICLAETLIWEEAAPHQDLSTRRNHAMAYDPRTDTVVLFGGLYVEWIGAHPYEQSLGDTWLWRDGVWQQVWPANAPSPRSGHTMTYDPLRQRIVLVGGAAQYGPGLSDTWEWDGVVWQERALAVAPPGRTMHAAAFDSTAGKLIVFGGIDTSWGDPFGDTWELDGTGWTQRTPAASPSARSFHAMAYDQLRQRIVLFGGSDDPNTWDSSLADTWEWDGSSWLQIGAVASPTARRFHTMAYDASAQRVLIYGGFAGANGVNADDLWSWNGTTWTQRATGVKPPARLAHSMAWVASQNAMMIMGGEDGNTSLGYDPSLKDTWLLAGATWRHASPSQAIGPMARHAAAYDDARGRIVVYGGHDYNYSEARQTWEWNGLQWILRTPAVSPTALAEHAMAYDAARRRTVLFGGRALYGSALAETWEWDGESWTNVTPASGPSARTLAAMAYDHERQRVVLFGGNLEAGVANDTWEWNGSVWTPRVEGVPPSPRRAHAMVYDAVRQRIVMFGGISTRFGSFGDLADTWEWNGASGIWAQRSPSVSPEARARHSMYYDSRRGKVIVYGGDRAEYGPLPPLPRGDLWEWDGTTWAKQIFSLTPPARSEAAAAYDARRQQAVLFGGWSGLDENFYPIVRSDSWRLTSTVLGAIAEHCDGYQDDLDGDGYAGCDDPDCDGVCDPFCLPNTSCAPGRERCGDGVCTAARENWGNCPADCPVVP